MTYTNIPDILNRFDPDDPTLRYIEGPLRRSQAYKRIVLADRQYTEEIRDLRYGLLQFRQDRLYDGRHL